MKTRFQNSQGKVWYGMHMYPGIAEYANGGKSFRVLINEATAKSLDPTFSGKPVFLDHVDEDDIDDDVDLLRNNADGWVIESFYNPADGKHWTKFITVTKRAERAINQGYKLSNCYAPSLAEKGGIYNGVSYQREVVGGEYEHLAIVPDPRYAESIILTPDQYKQYNADKTAEISRLSNNSKGKIKMKLQFFKREKLSNAKDIDLENLSVMLPQSKKERSIIKLVNEADERELARGKPVLVDLQGLVALGEEEITVEELIARHQEMLEELEAIKDGIEEVEDDIEDEEDSFENSDEEGDEEEELENEEDDPKPSSRKASVAPAAKRSAAKIPSKGASDKAAASKVRNDQSDIKRQSAEDRKKAKEKADRLRNASERAPAAQRVIATTGADRVALGKSRYGS